jgi:predicted RNase H-like HicB family nuclease
MKKTNIKFALPVTILRENKSFIAYTPALDISTVGDTFEEAKKKFEELVQIFFEEVIEKKTLDQVLIELGWTKQEKTFIPPTVVSHNVETFSIPAPTYC